MSLSNPSVGESPVKTRFRIKANAGQVVHWNKAANQEVVHDLPFRGIVLDVLNTVGGWSDAHQSGIWANEVRTNNDVLRVRTKAGPLIEGPYNEIKDALRGKGGKFANSLYLAYRDGDEWALGNLNLVGASLSAFFDYRQNVRLDSDPGIAITGFEAKTKGATKYFAPIFERLKVSEDSLAAAVELDKVLQEYLDGSLKARAEAIEQEQRQEDPWANASQSSLSPSFDAAPPF